MKWLNVIMRIELFLYWRGGFNKNLINAVEGLIFFENWNIKFSPPFPSQLFSYSHLVREYESTIKRVSVDSLQLSLWIEAERSRAHSVQKGKVGYR